MSAPGSTALAEARKLRRYCRVALREDRSTVARIAGPVIVSDLGEFALARISVIVQAEALCDALRAWIEEQRPERPRLRLVN